MTGAAVQVELAQWDLCVWGVHLDVYDETGTMRVKQVQQLHTLMAGAAKTDRGCVLLAGDCNALRREVHPDALCARARVCVCACMCVV